MTDMIDLTSRVFIMLIVTRVLLEEARSFGWVNIDDYHPVVRFINRASDIFLRPIRRILPTNTPIEISAVIVMGIAITVTWVLLGIFR
jgi:uncharacterized protein YggT (Ycf19 family)